MLASAAAAAQPAPPPGPPDLSTTGALPPGMTEPMLMPPGMTPAEAPDDCRQLPDGTVECPQVRVFHLPTFSWGGTLHHIHRGHREHVYTGGFGHYFWSAGS